MRAFGSLWIVCVATLIFLSLAECMPNKNQNREDYPDDGEIDDDDYGANEDDAQAGDNSPSLPVHFISENTTLKASIGDTVEFPCLVDNAEDSLTTWMRDNEILFTDEKAYTENEKRFVRAGNRSLILHGVTQSDASHQYRCKILAGPNDAPEIVYQLQIVEKPREMSTGVRVTPSKRVHVDENNSIKFGCEVNIEPKPEMKWSHEGVRLHNGEIIEDGGNSVRIVKATRHHAGTYQCLAENSSEKPPHGAIEVIVKYAPEIDVEHPIVHTGTGTKSELTCIVHAHPHADVTWHKNDKIINEKKDKRRFLNQKTHRTLVIEHTQESDFGQYTCTAKNPLGRANKTIELTGTPSRPTFIGGEFADDETTLRLKWRVESYAPIEEYKLEYRRKGETTWTTASPRVTSGSGNQFIAEHEIEGLLPVLYEAKLMARNVYGWSQHSHLHNIRGEYKSEEAEQSVKGLAATSQPIFTLTTLVLTMVSSYACL